MGGACSGHGGDEKCILNFVGKPEEKRPLKRHRHRCEYNIKIDLTEMELDTADWIHLAQDGPMTGYCEYGTKPSGSIEVGEFLDYYHQLLKEDSAPWH
jgi:hypothetical protein